MEQIGLKFAIVTGSIGTLLGLLNTIRAFSRDRVKVRVKTGMVVDHNGFRGFSIVVVNLSRFPISLREIGFLLRRPRGNKLLLVKTMAQYKFPCSMEPRTSFGAEIIIQEEDKKFIPSIKGVYVETECGSRFSVSGKDPILKEFIRQSSPSEELES